MRASRLSRQGEHAAALALCKMRNVEVLSRAGMYLSVLSLADSSSLERALALLYVGNIEEAIKITASHGNLGQARALVGYLAANVPDRVWPLIADKPRFFDIDQYCRLALGVPGSVQGERDRLPEILGLSISLSRGELAQAEGYLYRLFNQAGLTPPAMDLTSGRLDISTIRCDAALANIDTPPLISVILTSHNEEKYLYHAAKSVLQQTWPALELIIVDDASTDDTRAVAERLHSEDHRVQIIRLQKNIGTWRAKNVGLAAAKGAYLTMHDADDWSHPEKLERQIIPLLVNHHLMSSSSYMFRVNEQTGLPFTRNAASFLRWNPCSLMYRRSVIDELGVYFQDLLGGDCEFSARIETHWGRDSHYALRLPLTIGWQRARGLSARHRASTRLTVPAKRLQDWENWRRLHIEHYRRRKTMRGRVEYPTLGSCEKEVPWHAHDIHEH